MSVTEMQELDEVKGLLARGSNWSALLYGDRAGGLGDRP